MKKITTALLIIVTLPSIMNAQENKFKSYWDQGYHVESEDGNFKMKFGGRIQFDQANIFQDSLNEATFGVDKGGTELRRIRLVNEGTIYKYVNYKVEFDFAKGNATVTDAFITLINLPVIGNIRVGHQKEPFSLNMMNSSNDDVFMETASVTSFKKQRNNGLLIFNTAFNERATWAIGAFQNTSGFGKSLPDNRYNITGRITALPYYKKDEHKLLHLGIAYSSRNPADQIYSVNTKPESNLSPSYVNIKSIPKTETNFNLGTELAFEWQQLLVQAEYISSSIKAEGIQHTFKGYYALASYFLTGEHQNYSPKDGWFKRVSPKKNFNPTANGWGAIEAAVRYSYLDLKDANINGGELKDITAGINWYLNPATRFSANYVHSMVKDLGQTNILQFRFQVVF